MLLLFSILSFLQGCISAIASPLLVFVPPDPPPQCVCLDLRSKWDIVWSCLVTIFACSWISVHPNIRAPGNFWKKGLHRLELMVWSIICPEITIYWAVAQWRGARELAKKYDQTQTVGHFIQMGGLMLHDGQNAPCVLAPEKLANLLDEGRINMPKINEEDIMERSNGDGLSKALVIVQTSWFVAQCIGRKAKGLIITELELVTLAFAVLNVIMYLAWRNKPLDIQTTVQVDLLPPNPPNSVGLNSAENIGDDRDGRDVEASSVAPTPDPRQGAKPPNPTWPACWPVARIISLTRKMSAITQSYTKIKDGQMYISTFYAFDPNPGQPIREDFALPVVGMLFGAINCAGWNFYFPSSTEAELWRVSSVVITATQAISPGLLVSSVLRKKYPKKFLPETMFIIFCTLWMWTIPLHVMGQLILLIDAFISLRDLPQGALAVVGWTAFIPHV